MSKNYIALAIPVFFLLIFLEFLVAWLQKRKVYRLNDTISDLSCGTGQQLTGIFLKGVLFSGYVWTYEHFSVFSFDLGRWPVWVLAFIGTDFCYYWWHRLSHQVNFLWAVHVVHHQSEEYNLAVALRQAWFSGLSSWIFYAPLAVLGIHPVAFVAMGAFNTLYQFWIHTRLIGKMGVLEKVVNTPALHRVHHARDWKYLDKNHGATLIVWDRLFGTYMPEQEEPAYGLVKNYTSWNPVWANFHYWVELWRICTRTKSWKNRLKVWLMYPGWYPEDVERPPSNYGEGPRIRFDTRVPQGLNYYVLVHYTPLMVVSTLVLYNIDSLSASFLLAYVAYVLFTTVVFGAIFEGRPWAFWAEIVRLALITVFLTILYGTSFTGLARIAFFGGAFLLPTLFAIWFVQYRATFNTIVHA